MGAFERKSSSEVPDTRNSAFHPERRVLQLFRAERTEMLKILPNIILGLTEVIGCVRAKKLAGGSGPAKQCIRARNTSFASFSCRTYRNYHFGSNGGYLVRSGEKARRRFRTPEIVLSAPKQEFCNFFMPNVPKRSKTLPNIVLVLTEVIGCVRAKKLVGGS